MRAGEDAMQSDRRRVAQAEAYASPDAMRQRSTRCQLASV
jgi:hypothetical protein